MVTRVEDACGQVLGAADVALSVSACSQVLDIRKQTGPAIAAMASTDAALLKDAAVQVLLDMLHHNDNLEIQVMLLQ